MLPYGLFSGSRPIMRKTGGEKIMATLRQRANKQADETISGAEERLEDLRSAKNRFNRRRGQQLDDTEARVGEAVENAGRKLRQTYEDSADYLEEQTESARRTVRENPLLAVSGAFIGGLIAAALFRRH